MHPDAIKVLDEIGIDASLHLSKSVDDLIKTLLIIWVRYYFVCRRGMPNIHNLKKLHWINEDPANKAYSEFESAQAFRNARDNIFKLIKKFYVEFTLYYFYKLFLFLLI